MNLKRAKVSAGACLAVLSGLLITPAPAGAAHLPPQYDYTFSGSGDHQIGEATAVAVDNETHDVYVADRANHRVEKFDANGTFLFMFGDGVNETTGENICPVNPGDVCRPGQQSSPTYPHFEELTSISVDNSNSSSKGDVYVGAQTISKFDSSGNLITSWGSNGQLAINENLLEEIKMGVSPFTGYLWVIDGGWRIDVFDDHGTVSRRTFGENWNILPGPLAVDAEGSIYYSSYGGYPLKLDHLQVTTPNIGPHAEIFFENQASGYAIDPTNGNIYIDSGSGTYTGEKVVMFNPPCEPSTGYCIPKESFGAGDISEGKGLAMDPGTGAVYVAEAHGVAYFKPLIIPDVTSIGAVPGRTTAEVSAHIDPAEGGEIIECQVEYGTTTSYGSNAPCDQGQTFANPADVTATLPGLTPESTYHYRFVAKNANGAGYSTDETVVPHWVIGLTTGDATEIGPGTATLHGTLNPTGEDVHYYFEWGTTEAYGHETPASPGADAGSGNATEEVSVSLEGLLTALTTYHYRVVAVNSLGTSHGFDHTFTTPISLLPEVRETVARSVGLTSAALGAEVNPGFGATAFSVQYGTGTGYGARTVISNPFADDGVFHVVQATVGGLEPGTKYHFRVLALNFKGTVRGEDATFTTAVLPKVNLTSASVLGPQAARLSTQVAVNSSSNPTTVHFEFGESMSYGGSTSETAPLGPDGTATADVSSLKPGTTYHFRAIASNPFGREIGPDQTFSTPPEQTATQPGGGPHPCRKGFVRRKGRCVRRRQHRHRGGRRGHRHG